MADDANEQTTPHWGTSAPDYEGEDPENEIELDPNMAELPLFAGLEAKKILRTSRSSARSSRRPRPTTRTMRSVIK